MTGPNAGPGADAVQRSALAGDGRSFVFSTAQGTYVYVLDPTASSDAASSDPAWRLETYIFTAAPGGEFSSATAKRYVLASGNTGRGAIDRRGGRIALREVASPTVHVFKRTLAADACVALLAGGGAVGGAGAVGGVGDATLDPVSGTAVGGIDSNWRACWALEKTVDG